MWTEYLHGLNRKDAKFYTDENGNNWFACDRNATHADILEKHGLTDSEWNCDIIFDNALNKESYKGQFEELGIHRREVIEWRYYPSSPAYGQVVVIMLEDNTLELAKCIMDKSFGGVWLMSNGSYRKIEDAKYWTEIEGPQEWIGKKFSEREKEKDSSNFSWTAIEMDEPDEDQLVLAWDSQYSFKLCNWQQVESGAWVYVDAATGEEYSPDDYMLWLDAQNFA